MATDYERALVAAVSNFVSAKLSDENEVVGRTTELVAAVKAVTAKAALTVESLHNVQLETEFQAKKDAVFTAIRTLVGDLRADLGKPAEQRRPRGALLQQLKALAQICKDLIDIAHAGDSDGAPEADIDDEDRAPSPTPTGTKACTICKKPVSELEEHLAFDDKEFWHTACFRCSRCSRQMMAREKFMLGADESIICASCSPKCKTCSQSVVGESTTALGVAYHVACFRCANCLRLLGDAGKFYPKNGDPYCGVCIARDSVFDKRWSPYLPEDYDVPTSPPPAGGPPATAPVSTAQQLNSKLARTSIAADASSASSSAPSASNFPLVKPVQGQQPIVQVATPAATATQQHVASAIPADKRKSFLNKPLPSRPRSRHADNPRCLEGCLSSEIGIDYLVEFCMEDFSVEKISFWLDVEQFKVVDVKKSEDLLSYAKTIHHKYIRSGAEMEVNLPTAIKARVDTVPSMTDVERNYFNEAQSFMFDELEKVVFPRFFYSNSGKKYLSLMSELGPPTTRLGTTSTAPLFQQTSNASLLNGGSKNAAHPRPRAFSDSDDERITSIEVTNFEKRFDKEKFYVYEIKVTREIREGGSAQKYPDDLFIYRRYSEFLQLHHELTLKFPDSIFPPLPPKIYIGRSQLKSVARNRLQNLDYYIKGILQLSDSVGRHGLLRTFLRPSDEDLANYWFNKRLSVASTNFRIKYH